MADPAADVESYLEAAKTAGMNIDYVIDNHGLVIGTLFGSVEQAIALRSFGAIRARRKRQ
ncbi:hypothetical protein V1291_002420 [Nitrobacteraceae bacterium AZCC 1564]